ncbi:urotensin-2 receptor-like [Myxocyprinus asiaticus]|uniref:urotensin-2 receptor-like n=1 Tax=Myxocyprinus asiaticus TaxID=70543 RepID=UPI002221A558|nr:urotensin-2 receptor-like [Myxocyprinus asiaticus]
MSLRCLVTTFFELFCGEKTSAEHRFDVRRCGHSIRSQTHLTNIKTVSGSRAPGVKLPRAQSFTFTGSAMNFNKSGDFNGPSRNSNSGSVDELVITTTFGTLLSVVYIVGVTGNVYTLVVMCHSIRFATSMYISIINLALADLLYLSTIPFVVCTYFLKDWFFGDVGCKILLSLDLLTMHASIFTLTVMCMERYLAVTKPLDTVKRSKSYRKAMACCVWILSLVLTLPMTIMVNQTTKKAADGGVKRMCAPTWAPQAYKIYLTVLFCTSIMAPGLVIGYLYTRLARTYLESQRTSINKGSKRSPKQKVLIMIFTIVLVFWACFLPFWIWQLVPLYHKPFRLASHTHTSINYLVSSLTYSNSCINPLLYTLLTKNYREYLKNRHKSFYRYTSSFKKRPPSLYSWGKSASSSNQFEFNSETLVMAQLKV